MRLNAIVSPLFRNLEGELQFIIRTQGDSIRAFCKGYSVGMNIFNTSRRDIDVTLTPLSVTGLLQTQRQLNEAIEQLIDPHWRLR